MTNGSNGKTNDISGDRNQKREILKIGIPSFLETLFTTFTAVIDSKMVSAMGVAAISAVSVTNQPRLFVYTIFLAINTVTTSLVAKYHGGGDRDGANRIFDHAMKIILILCVLLSALTVLLARPIMLLFSGQPDTLDDSVVYFRIVMAGMIFNLLYLEINSALRGVGKTSLTFADNVLSCGVNLFFNYLLIEGHWGFPAWGIAGAAVATVLGNAAACILSLVFVCKKKQFISIPYCISRRYRMTKDSLRELLNMTKSCAIDNLAMRATLLVISGITARIGSFQMAIYSAGNYLMNVNFALGTGLQTSAVTLVGRSLGEGDPKRLSNYRKHILRIGLISASVLAVIIMLGGKFFYAFFSEEEAFVSTGTISCCFIGVITIFQTLKFINNGCLQGVGMMKESMFCSIISFSCVNLGLVALLVLVFHTGIWGVWTGTLASQATQALMLHWYIRKTPVFSGNAGTVKNEDMQAH